jgi:predicted NUDIX family NTP pyrophosphohydrolase
VPQVSAGILLYRWRGRDLQVLLVHPGGPFWRSKDQGAWMLPKGGVEPGEEPLAAALREFQEELGSSPPGTPFPLGRVRQAGGKMVEAFGLEGDLDPDRITSTLFEMEWPPRSGQRATFPEVDKAAWFSPEHARAMMLPSQIPILDALLASLPDGRPP